MSREPFHLHEIRFIKRIVVGSDNAAIKTEAEIAEAMDLLNRCLNDTPKGYLIGVDKGFNVLYFGENQLVTQYTTYHVGWARKPLWLP